MDIKNKIKGGISKVKKKSKPILVKSPVPPTKIKILQDTNAATCPKTVTYSLGELDPRFNLSAATALSGIESATNVWQNHSNSQLFLYKPVGGEVKINFIYDERQINTDFLTGLKNKIDEKKQILNQKQLEYNNQVSTFKSLKNAIEDAQGSFDIRALAYNQKVSTHNQYFNFSVPELNAQKTELQNEAGTLNNKQLGLQENVNMINSLGEILRELSNDINIDVSTFNNKVNSSKEIFQEGQYVIDQTGKRVDVFEYTNRVILVRLLAHEFGHSLGIGHLDDKEAIMYKINSSQTLELTSSDIAALNALCTKL